MSDSYTYGFHAVTKMLQLSPEACQELICRENKNPRLLSVIALARQGKLSIRFESREQLAALAGTEKHQGCVLLARFEAYREFALFGERNHRQ